MKNKIVLVTGGSKGYGAGIAEVLGKAGAHVWITGRDQVALEKTAKRLGATPFQADVTSPADWDRLFEAILKRHRRLDVLVNNAGAGVKIAPMDEQTDEDIAQSVTLNLTGALYGCRRAAKVMKKQKSGIIINISSACALYAWPGWGPYSAAKAGINQFAHCLYTELRPFGVRVTTITPSWGASDFVAASDIAGHPAGDAKIKKKCMQPVEMGRLVEHVCTTPAHLEIMDITVQPMIQEIMPL